MRSRFVEKTAQNGGLKCSGAATDVQACGTTTCINAGHPVNCIWGTWTSWSQCNCRETNGTQVRSRTIQQAVQNGGVPCVGEASEIGDCGKCGMYKNNFTYELFTVL